MEFLTRTINYFLPVRFRSGCFSLSRSIGIHCCSPGLPRNIDSKICWGSRLNSSSCRLKYAARCSPMASTRLVLLSPAHLANTSEYRGGGVSEVTVVVFL